MEINTPDWVRDAVFYQIFPDRFARGEGKGRHGRYPRPTHLQEWGAPPTYHAFQGGNLWGVSDKLDYLVDLGVNAIYFNPIFTSAANHRYHTHDYFTIDPILGGNEAFAAMLEAAHSRDIRVILDGVFNHASRGFFPFNHLMENGAESPYVGWFHVHDFPVNAYREDQPPSFSAWWGARALPKLNTDNPEVRDYLWDAAVYWLEQGIDGWRLDVPNEIDDDAFWQEFRRRCRAVNPEAYIVGELWHEAHRWLQGDQFDGQMNYMFTRAAFGFLLGDNMDQRDTARCGYGHIPTLNGAQFANELNRQFNQLYDPAIVLAQMNMLGSHDTPRLLTVAREDKTAARLLFLLQMSVPGAPNVYYGDEIGLPGGHDPDCRRAFPWHDEASWDKELLADVRRLIALRHELPVLRRGDFSILTSSDQTAVFQRRYEGRTAVVAFNAGNTPQTFTLPESVNGLLAEKWGGGGTAVSGGGVITLPGRSARLWAGNLS